MKRALVLTAALFVIGASAPLPALASEAETPPAQSWPQDGMTGTFDRAALQRGYQVYRQVCSACHAMKRVSYRNLSDLGYSEDQIKGIAAEYTVTDGPNDEGEMFDRPARPSDHFKSPFPNDNAAKASNGGALPPDLSLIAKARAGGPDYIYALLTGYGEPPHGHELMAGQHWNKYMAGNVIAMPPPLSDGMVSYADGSPETVSQYAHDVAQFLTWAADPKLEERKRTGLKALLFLLVFTGIMYAAKRKIWSDLH